MITKLEPLRLLTDAPTSTDTNDTEETIVHGISTDGFVRPKFNPALNEWQVFNTATNAWQRG